MKYEKVVKGKFIDRPNRFVALVEVDGERVKAHVKNTGRCRELLVPGAEVYLEDFADNMRNRKMRYSLVGVEKAREESNLMINMDSQAPNKVVAESLALGTLKLPGMNKVIKIKPEKTYGESRLDFYIEDCCGAEGYIEVKGVTLETDGIASFPDATTERGIKHIKELEGIVDEGKKAFVVFVIQMEGMKGFRPNDITHKAFGDALRCAEAKGVGVLAYECKVTEDTLILAGRIPVQL